MKIYKNIMMLGILALALIAFMIPAQAGALDWKQTPMSSDGVAAATPAAVLAAGETGVIEPVALGELTEHAFAKSPVTEEEFASVLPAVSFRQPAGAESIYQWDSRQRLYTTQWPAMTTVRIVSDIGQCTGWIVGANTVITAGHCVHTGGSGGRWATTSSVRVYPGYDTINNVAYAYGTFYAKQLWSVVGWTVSGNVYYDYGAIKLTANTSVGSFGVTTTQLLNRTTIISGYPGDKTTGSQTGTSQWTSSDKARVINTYQILHRNDTIGGQSGSPVWFDNNGPYVYGIHTYAMYGVYPTYNRATRITTSVFNNILYWRNLP